MHKQVALHFVVFIRSLHCSGSKLNTLTISEKGSTTDLQLDSKCGLDQRCCRCGVWAECKCMESVDTGWCTKKWLRLYQTIRNLTTDDMGILLVVIQLGVTRLKRIRLMYLLDLFEGRVENGQCDLRCVEHLWMIGLMVVMLMFYSHLPFFVKRR